MHTSLVPRRLPQALRHVLPIVLAALAGAAARAEIAVQNGQKIAFLGDSITEGGWGNPFGYVRLVMAGLQGNGIKANAVPAGISGHKSNQMLGRLQRDVLDKKPDWMTLSCGVNDVWHGANGVPLDQYKTNITAIVDRAQAAGVKVIILTATVIGEELDNANNRKLQPYNDFLRALAKEKRCGIADLYADFETVLKAGQAAGRKGLLYTSDGVHMNGPGNEVMAVGVLRAMGLNEAELTKARDAWLDIPGGATVNGVWDAGNQRKLTASFRATKRQRDALVARAERDGKSVEQYLGAILGEEARSVFQPEALQRLLAARQEREVQAVLQAGFNTRVEALLK